MVILRSRVLVYVLISGMIYVLLATSAAFGAPLSRSFENCPFSQGLACSCPIKNYVVSLDSPGQGKAALIFNRSYDAVHANVLETPASGMLDLRSGDASGMPKGGKEAQDLLFGIFAGSFMIGLSGIIKIHSKKQPLEKPEEVHAPVRVSYEHTLLAE